MTIYYESRNVGIPCMCGEECISIQNWAYNGAGNVHEDDKLNTFCTRTGNEETKTLVNKNGAEIKIVVSKEKRSPWSAKMYLRERGG